MEPLENWGKYLMEPLGFGGTGQGKNPPPVGAGRGGKRREEEFGKRWEEESRGLTIVEEDIGGLEKCLC